MGDYAPFLERAFELTPCERSYRITEVEGEIPEFIRGTYYLNGPARFTRASMPYRHWLDGDGMVCALRIGAGKAIFTNRFVRSHKFTAETAAGHPLFRAFGTAFTNDRMLRGLALESPVNVSVYPYGDTLLAFGEQGLPWELDPLHLTTRDVYNFGGRLNSVSPFSAHPKFDPHTGDMFNFGIAFSSQNPQLHVYRFDVTGHMQYRKRIRLDYPCSIHDCSLSSRYLVFYLSPYLLDMPAMANEGYTLMEALRWEPKQGSRLLLVSRDSGDTVASVPIGESYCLHLINSFEQGDQVIIDVVEYTQPIYDQYQPIPDLFTDVREARPVRFMIDPQCPTRVQRRELAPHLFPDFPTLDPRLTAQPYQDFWMLAMGAPRQHGRKFFNQLLHLRWNSEAYDYYQAPVSCYFGGEPVFIGDAHDPGAGVIMCQVFDAEHTRSAFALFDAFNIVKGPICMMHLQEPVPLLFHASFQPGQPGVADATVPTA